MIKVNQNSLSFLSILTPHIATYFWRLRGIPNFFYRLLIYYDFEICLLQRFVTTYVSIQMTNGICNFAV